MERLRRRLPPLTALVVFEAAARLQSFTLAAQEMCITQAAVSRQVRLLEGHLGNPLFIRNHRSVALTTAGQRLFEAVDESLERIAQASTEIRSDASGAVTIAATVCMATYWLMPRLDAFQQQHPQVALRLFALDREVDLRAENVDMAITCGNEGQRHGVRMSHLMDEVLVPLCSPGYLQGRTLSEPQQLLGERLLNLDREHWRGFNWAVADWGAWFDQMNVRGVLPPARLAFNNHAQQIQATVDGRGIALGSPHMLADLLVDGRLVEALPQRYATRRGYYLAVNEHSSRPRAVAALHTWLQGEGHAATA
ncbi:LysR substrate-binding domain-containing protein [Pseudomonas typographi]|uniref:LysR family transcriptional regulator n=1 Tax=Pseudomonas typographi TaxID=2715964 RepID=A0ABR7Z9H2_9PSED|nr:LysR substrate-binding domain-containing protein [Pseudomonas typographi]MBD1552296.1 LysR family transcriptional regulator [Pseudomonas typographi]MBD1587416.1 LysR family transcriptional regulator [Pseudomonas typographi]MBD1601943.1 LysR family transcriptional regulator [Pseudomonas typographi]